MTKQLTVHNAEVRTAAVEVRSLTISGKQVTLAVFRQLLQEHPFDGKANWKGIPWGFVNYLNDDREARHVVWQLGTELRRGIVKQPPKKWHPLTSKLSDMYVTALVCLGHVESMENGFGRGNPGDPPSHYDIGRVGLIVGLGDGLTCKGRLLATKSYRMTGGEGRWEWDDRTPLDLDGIAEGLAVLTQRVVAEAETERSYWQAETQRWQETLALEQLFIAV